ncbi:MAG: hypothetical protein L0154_05900 [Chloroflexi bacterium]|nr:hypothetical protein [Chloroflexota bacterium]
MIQDITPQELKEKLDNNEDIVVIDVRELWELDITKVDFAEHIVMNTIPQRLDDIPDDKPVVFICRTGSRSTQVALFLMQNGWDPEYLYNLDGGILAWARDIDPSLPTHY